MLSDHEKLDGLVVSENHIPDETECCLSEQKTTRETKTKKQLRSGSIDIHCFDCEQVHRSRRPPHYQHKGSFVGKIVSRNLKKKTRTCNGIEIDPHGEYFLFCELQSILSLNINLLC